MSPGPGDYTPDFQAFFQQAPAALLVTTADGMILEVNDTCVGWLGLPRSELCGSYLLPHFALGDRIMYATQALPQLALAGSLSEVAVDLLHTDGSRLPVLLSARRTTTAAGVVDHLVLLAATERRGYEHELERALRQAEEAERARARAEAATALHRTALQESAAELRESLRRSRRNESLLNAVLDTVDVGIAVVDADGTTVMSNTRFQHDLDHATPGGAGPEGTPPTLFYGPDRTTVLSPQERPLARAARGESFANDLVWMGPPNDLRALTVSARTVTGTEEFHGAVVATGDVTQLLNALAAKDDFVANVSHELRTPLTSILGYLDLLLEEPELSPTVASALQIMLRNAERLLHLVNDLLSAAAAGGLIEPSATDMSQLIQASISSAAPRAAGNGVQIRAVLPDSLPAWVDPLRMAQVLDNLLSNAIKYSPTGGSVVITATAHPERLIVEVRDEGLGMSEEEVREAFTKFFRSHTVRKAAIPGAGLGLAITKNIVEAHHGTITLSSALGRGTTVTLSLPRR